MCVFNGDNTHVQSHTERTPCRREWCGVCDECDVWLEARELFAALNATPLWAANVPVSAAHLRAFEDCKLVAMGVSYFEATRDEAELDYVSDSAAELLEQYTPKA